MLTFTIAGVVVKPLILTEETVQIIQKELPRLGHLPDGVSGFMASVSANDSLLWQIGEPIMGVTGVMGVRPGIDALGQVFIWDRRLFRETRVAIVATMFNIVFELLALRRITARVVSNNRVSQRFTKDVGFTLEGRLRNTELFKGKILDTLIYGLLQVECCSKNARRIGGRYDCRASSRS